LLREAGVGECNMCDDGCGNDEPCDKVILIEE